MKFIWIQVGELVIANPFPYRKHIKYVEQRLVLSNTYRNKLALDYPLMFFLEQHLFGRVPAQKQLWAAEHISHKVTL